MAPVHADECDSAILELACGSGKRFAKEGRESRFVHLPGCNGEFPMLDPAETTHMTGDGDIVRRIGKQQPCGLTLAEPGDIFVRPGIAA